MFGTGLVAAAELRRQILERLGAEPEWTEGDHDSVEMRWTSGPVTTFFTVEPGAEATPDLGVLRVTSPVAAVGDRRLGLQQCLVLNMAAMTHRWTIGPTVLDPDTEILQVSCSFVVGPAPPVASGPRRAAVAWRGHCWRCRVGRRGGGRVRGRLSASGA